MVYNIITIATLTNLIILAIILLVIKSNLKQANTFLAFLLICLAINMIDYIIWHNHLNNKYVWTASFGYLSTALIGPLFYFYVLAMLNRNISLNYKRMWHLIPFLVALLNYLRFHLQTKEEKIEYISSAYSSYPLIELYLNVFFAFVIIGYILVSYKELQKHRKNIKNYFSDIKKINLIWLNRFVVIIGILFFIFAFLSTIIHNEIFNETAGQLILTVFYLFIFIKTIKHPSIYNIYGESMKNYMESGVSGNKNMGINNVDTDEIFDKLIEVIEHDKIYLNPKLTLSELASCVNVHPYILSQIINTKTNNNFYSLINKYRVQEAKDQLISPGNDNLTIEAIGLQCGFNSPSAFFDVFKKIEGTTPNQHRKLYTT